MQEILWKVLRYHDIFSTFSRFKESEKKWKHPSSLSTSGKPWTQDIYSVHHSTNIIKHIRCAGQNDSLYTKQMLVLALPELPAWASTGCKEVLWRCCQMPSPQHIVVIKKKRSLLMLFISDISTDCLLTLNKLVNIVSLTFFLWPVNNWYLTADAHL